MALAHHLRSALFLALLICVSTRLADGARQLQAGADVLVTAPFTYVAVDKATGVTKVVTPWSNTYAVGGRRLQQDNKDNGNNGNNGNQVEGKYYPGYIMLAGQSVGGSNMRDAGSAQDAFLACNLDVNCQAFNTDGMLKTNIGGAEVTPGYKGVTYVKRVILPPISVDAPFTHVNVGPGGQTTVDAPNAKVNTNTNNNG